MKNIFCLSTRLTEEDRFTAAFCYLIDSIPNIGQALVDLFSAQSDSVSSRFLNVEDHPRLSSVNRPDLRIACDDFDIVCEHKIVSGLGPLQLERYLSLRQDKPYYLVLVARSVVSVSDQVLRQPHFLRPREQAANHFRWHEIYPIVASRSERLARDFTDYMKLLGMEPEGAISKPVLLIRPMPKHTVEEVYKSADADGIGKDIRSIGIATSHWLQPKTVKNTIVFTPKQSLKHVLFTVLAEASPEETAQIYVNAGAFSDFYVISRRDVISLIGEEGWRGMDSSAVEDFISGLNRIFQKVAIKY